MWTNKPNQVQYTKSTGPRMRTAMPQGSFHGACRPFIWHGALYASLTPISQADNAAESLSRGCSARIRLSRGLHVQHTHLQWIVCTSLLRQGCEPNVQGKTASSEHAEGNVHVPRGCRHRYSRGHLSKRARHEFRNCVCMW